MVFTVPPKRWDDFVDLFGPHSVSLLEAYPKEPSDKRILPADHASEVEK
jgi:hypothetical protein